MQKTIARLALGTTTALATVAGLVGSPAATAAAPRPVAHPAAVQQAPTPAAPAEALPAQTGLFGEVVTAAAPESVATIPAMPIAAPLTYTVGPVYTLTNTQKIGWFNYLLKEIDPYRKGIWVLDLYGTRTSPTNRGNTYPQSYGKARPVVYIYGKGLWNTWQIRNTMWHERMHVTQTYDVGYSRARYILGGISGMEATAVCQEHIKYLIRPGWGCTSYWRYRATGLNAGWLR